METASPKQRPAWLYVLIGCGAALGLLVLLCLAGGLTCGKVMSDAGKGFTDPEAKQENALKQLGAIPQGYSVQASVDVMFAQTTTLVEGEVLSDGGINLNNRLFVYRRVMGNDGNRHARDYLQGRDVDPMLLMNTGINPDPAAQLKRGVLKIDGRQLYYVSARAPLNTDPAILTTVLFDCPGDALMLGSWGQLDPAPQKPKEELDLEGTVADEAELARFLKQFNPPCR